MKKKPTSTPETPHEESQPPNSKGKGRGKGQLKYNPLAEIVRDVHVPLLTGLSHPTIWRLRNAGEFVPEIKLSKTAVAFRRSDIEAWIVARTITRVPKPTAAA